jgi:hypothetical protein
MGLPPVIDAVRRQPGMFVVPETLDGVLAFLTGYDIALSGGFLTGFREWLVTKLGYGNNLAWSGLICEIINTEIPRHDEKTAIERLFVLLEQFADVRNTHDGLRQIFVEYEQWLHRQEWYTSEHPGWLAPTTEAKLRRRRKKRRSSS